MKQSSFLMIFLAFACAAAILAVDALTPLGISDWVFYLLPLLFSSRIRQRNFPFVYAAVSVVFMGVGYKLSPPGGFPEYSLISRGIGAFVILITAAILVRSKSAEAAHEELQARFLSFMNHTSAVAWMKDKEFRYVYVNVAWEKMFQKELAAIRGKTDFELWPGAVAQVLRKSDIDVVTSCQNSEFSEMIITPDGKERFFLVHKFPFTDAEGRKYVGGMASEVTERKQAEEKLRDSERRLRSIWDNSVDAMRLTDKEGMTVAVNPAYCKLVNVTPEVALGCPFCMVYAGDQSLALRQYRERFGKRTIEAHFDRKITLVSGKVLFLGASNSFVELEHQPALLLSILRDNTEKQQQEDHRTTLERKLLDGQKLESLGVLAGGIAHDFNNLLTGVLGNAGLAMMQVSEVSPARPYLNHIEKLCLQAADLCKQMLAYSGRGQFQKQKINLNELIREMTQLLQISINKKIILKYNLAKNLSAIEGDPSQIRQVIMNLIINASEAIGDKSGVVSIITGVMHADHAYLTETYLAPDLVEGDYVYLEVADTGSGMTAETKARIFDPFFTTKFTGRGLGLAAVLGIVRGHHGALKVYSEVNKGTTFKFLLPASSQMIREMDTAQLRSTRWKGKGTVLIVDDEDHVREVARHMVQFFGFDAICAVDGNDGVQKYQENNVAIDVVLLDMMMPGLNGEEVFREIRRMTPHAKVILTSGYNEQDATNQFIGKGLAGFLQKPFKAEELQAKLRAILEAK